MASATEELEERREAVRAAEQRLREAEAERLQSRRRLDRVKAPLQDYHERLGAGEHDPDPEEERRLREAVREVEGSLTTRPVLADGHVTDFELVDDAAEARAQGAARALEDRREELHTFAAERLPDLLAERVPASLEVGARLRRALEELVAVDAEWVREVAAYRGLAGLAGADELRAELPRRSEAQRAALIEWSEELREDPGALVPVPRSLLPPPGDEG